MTATEVVTDLAGGAGNMLTIDSVPIDDALFESLQKTCWLMPGKGRFTLIGGQAAARLMGGEGRPHVDRHL